MGRVLVNAGTLSLGDATGGSESILPMLPLGPFEAKCTCGGSVAGPRSGYPHRSSSMDQFTSESLVGPSSFTILYLRRSLDQLGKRACEAS